MIDLKLFREENNLKQGEVADYLGVSIGFISQIERKKAKLSRAQEKSLVNNDRGWIVEGAEMVEAESQPSDWPAIFADLSAKVGEQNKQIDRLLTIVEQLTAEKK